MLIFEVKVILVVTVVVLHPSGFLLAWEYPQMSPMITARQPLGLVTILLFCWCPVCHLQLWRENEYGPLQTLGYCLATLSCINLFGQLLKLVSYCSSFIPGWRSVCRIDSKVAFLWELVCFSTRFTGLVETFWLSLTAAVVVVVVGVRVSDSIVVFSVFVVTFSFLFLSFQLAVFISVKFFFLSKAAPCFGSVSIYVIGTFAFCVHLQVIMSFQAIPF